MPPSILADAVLVVHALFVLFVALGGFLVVRWIRLAWVHLPCALWGAWIELSGGVCPLTPLENELRRQAGEGGYAGGFIETYVTAALYPQGLTRTHQIVLGVGVILLNAALYTWAVRRRSAGQPPGDQEVPSA